MVARPGRTWMRLGVASSILGTRICSTPSSTVASLDPVELLLGGVVGDVPLALDGQQAVLEGDLQVVGLDAGQLDRHQVGVLPLGDVQRWRPGRGHGPTAALLLAVQAERVGKHRAHLGHLILRAAQVLERVPPRHGSHLVSLLGGPCGPPTRGGRRSRVADRRSLAEHMYSIVNTVHRQDRRSDEVNMRERSVPERAKAAPSKRASATSGEPATDGRSRWLWFNAPTNDQDRRPELTRERVVAEALTVIAPHR